MTYSKGLQYTRMVWRELAPADLYDLRNPLIIDVRSPGEFSAERIPEAVNVPLLDNGERQIVGTVYKEKGESDARRLAVRLISPKIPETIEKIIALKEHSQTIVVHCWRGGLRSEAVASVLSIAGLSSFRLSGGYKAWRAMVLQDLREDRYPFEAIVLYGLSGVAKTELLHELSRLEFQVIDLEDLANHRGSVFGGLGKTAQPTQKNFEAAIWNQLRKIDHAKPVFIEAESRKIGRLSLPDPVFKRIQTGRAVLVCDSLDSRARRLAEVYLSSSASNESAFTESLHMLNQIKDSIGKRNTDEICRLAEKGEFVEAIRILLIEYYDPLYSRALYKKNFELTLSSFNPYSAAAELKESLCLRT